MKLRVALLAASIPVFSATAAAQRALTLNLGGGVSLPVAHFSDVASPGWHGLASIAVSTFMQPLGLRLDGGYNRFSAESEGADHRDSSDYFDAALDL